MKDNVWLTYSKEDEEKLFSLSERYKTFISTCKTERECTAYFCKEAEKAGYESLEDRIASGRPLKEGDMIYASWMGKTLVMFQIGSEPITDGMNILCAHIDSPRLDLKQVPLYENSELAYLDTHYYGGIKKYQWVTIPMALRGVVVKKDGTVLHVNIGDDPEDPVVYITDLLIHLAGQQMNKKASEVVTGENLDLLIGSIPMKKEQKDKENGEDEDTKAGAEEKKDASDTAVKEAVKANILKILEEKYQIEEDDFISAEIEAVPAGPARDCGLDRSMIAGYGHDDRSCAYPSFEAMIESGPVKRTSCCLLVDKEEIGSMGATGMKSAFFENTVAEILALSGLDSSLALRRTLARSKMLSSDVSAAFDPAFAECFDKKNCAFFGKGLVIHKFTGSRGKYNSNDANAEYMAEIRRIFDENKVAFHTAELGKVDLGGGGTIAYIAALYGMNVIDSGVAVLSMHSPCEIISKADLYEAKKGYLAFLLNA